MPDEDDLKWFNYTVPTVTMPYELAPQGGSIIEMFLPMHQNLPVDDWDEQKKEKVVESAMMALSRIHKVNIAVKRALSPKDFQDRATDFCPAKGIESSFFFAKGSSALCPDSCLDRQGQY